MGMGHWNITIIVMVGVFGFLLGSFGINSSTNDISLQTDSVMALGHLELVLKDADGNIKQYQQTDNLIVNEGANTMADLIFPDIDLNSNSTDNKFNIIGIGESSNTAIETDLGLIGPVFGCTNSTATLSGFSASLPSLGAEVILSTTFFGDSGCRGDFQEAVIQNDLAGTGEILTRKTFTVITIGSGDSLSIDWTIELGAGT